MRIFITGADGFIGQHLTRALIKEGHQVFALVCKKEGIKEIEKLGAKAILGDLNSLSFFKNIFDEYNIEVIYHLAAIRDRWGTSFEEYHKINVQGTENLLKASQSKIKHFIFCSSVAAIGYPGKMPISEVSPCDPKNLYGKSKLKAEKICKDYQKKGLSVTIIRPAVTYGPGDSRGMILKFSKLIKDGKLKIIGNGKNHLQFIYIEDLISGFLLAKNPKVIGQTYILAYKNSITLDELAKLIADNLGIKFYPINQKSPFFRTGIYGVYTKHIPLWFAKPAGFLMENFYKLFSLKKEPLITTSKVDIISKNQIYDISKAQNELDFNPKIDYLEGISKTIKWYEENGYI